MAAESKSSFRILVTDYSFYEETGRQLDDAWSDCYLISDQHSRLFYDFVDHRFYIEFVINIVWSKSAGKKKS